MKTKNLILICLALFSALQLQAQGTTRVGELEKWQFRKGHDLNAGEGWEEVRIPHDWAISGPFDRANDLQNVAVVQNGEVRVNGFVCTMRGKKLRPGDKVSFQGLDFEIVQA